MRTTAENATTLAFAWKDERGDGHFWILRGADAMLDTSDAAAAGIADLAALVVGSVSLSAEPSATAIERAVALARRAGVAVVFDVNLRPSLWPDLRRARPICERVAAQSTLVKLSLDDARGLFGADETAEQAIARVLALGAPAVVLTDGERGCWFSRSSGEQIGFVPAFAVDAVEPTGAGDAFTAALVVRGLAADWSPLTADDLRYAAAAGALATTRAGAWEGLPTHADLAAFLAR
jgi:fructokinase